MRRRSGLLLLPVAKSLRTCKTLVETNALTASPETKVEQVA